MNCDQAFEQLTDPTRSYSAPLEAHLAECPRCRHMREALSPALACFGSPEKASSADIEPAGNPGNAAGAHFLSVEAVQVAEAAARQLAARRQVSRPPVHAFTGLAAACAAIIMVAAAMTLDVVRNDRLDFAPAAFEKPMIAACTRADYAGERDPLVAVNSRSVVLSCMGCHLSAH